MEKELAMNEVEVFSKLHHPNIIWWVEFIHSFDCKIFEI